MLPRFRSVIEAAAVLSVPAGVAVDAGGFPIAWYWVSIAALAVLSVTGYSRVVEHRIEDRPENRFDLTIRPDPWKANEWLAFNRIEDIPGRVSFDAHFWAVLRTTDSVVRTVNEMYVELWIGRWARWVRWVRRGDPYRRLTAYRINMDLEWGKRTYPEIVDWSFNPASETREYRVAFNDGWDAPEITATTKYATYFVIEVGGARHRRRVDLIGEQRRLEKKGH